MSGLWILLLMSFVESLATILVERGVYFFTSSALGFSRAMNLWMAMAFGVAYALGAVASHPAAARIGERKMLAWNLVVHIILLAVLAAFWGSAWVVVTLVVILGLFSGAKWPVIESYVSAGRAPSSVARAVGLFNISWALAVPISLVLAGPLIQSPCPWLLFVLAAGLTVVSLLLCLPLTARPSHLAVNDPQRPLQVQLVRMKSLLAGSRWMHLCSYGMLWVLAALMPAIFGKLGVEPRYGAGLSGLVDFCRLGAFVVLQLWVGWHFRLRYLALAIAAMPLGFALVLCGPSLPFVLAGEVIFGLSGGVVYYSALYYGMVVTNAAVEGGGAHEGLIGAGFALGPACALMGMLMPGLGQGAVIVGVGAMFAVCLGGSLVHLRKAGSTHFASPGQAAGQNGPETPG